MQCILQCKWSKQLQDIWIGTQFTQPYVHVEDLIKIIKEKTRLPGTFFNYIQSPLMMTLLLEDCQIFLMIFLCFPNENGKEVVFH